MILDNVLAYFDLTKEMRLYVDKCLALVAAMVAQKHIVDGIDQPITQAEQKQLEN